MAVRRLKNYTELRYARILSVNEVVFHTALHLLHLMLYTGYIRGAYWLHSLLIPTKTVLGFGFTLYNGA